MYLQSFNEEGINNIVDKYSTMVYKLAFARTRSKEHADDIFQEVFLRYMRKKPKFKNENHVIGFGYDGTEWGTNGKLKLALFDVSDLENPREKFKTIINASDSELLDNHKSLLFSKERTLIAFSVGNYRTDKVGKVFTIDLEKVFVLRGDIKHNSDVARMLYMDDVLYGVSETNVSAHNINTVEELNRIDL